MLDLQQIEAAVLELMRDAGGPSEDSHEVYLRLHQVLDGMRAMGMPPPDDLVAMEARMAERFAADARPSPPPQRPR